MISKCTTESTMSKTVRRSADAGWSDADRAERARSACCGWGDGMTVRTDNGRAATLAALKLLLAVIPAFVIGTFIEFTISPSTPLIIAVVGGVFLIVIWPAIVIQAARRLRGCKVWVLVLFWTQVLVGTAIFVTAGIVLYASCGLIEGCDTPWG